MAPAGYGGRVEGLHAVTAAARSGRVEELWVDRPGSDEIIELVRAGGGTVRRVDSVAAMATTGAPQGLVARCRPLTPSSLDTLASGRPALMVLDHLQDPHNLGAIARSSLAAGLTGLVVASRRAAPLSAVAFKAAAGALERLPVAVVGSIGDAISRLGKSGVWSVGLDAAAPQPLFGLRLLTEPVALVVGEEGGGLSRLVRERLDLVVAIPLAGGTESLNASVAAGLAAFEVMRVRGG
jgi:23S rRNA (guanosine2251-2'-O)-methyltransferase